MRFGRELTEAELEVYERDRAYLLEYDYSIDLVPMLASNAAEVTAQIGYAEAVPYEALATPASRKDATRETNRTIVNYLTSFRLYIDHVQTRLTRYYGSGSAMLTRWRSIASTMHDESAAYRIIYNLRNYVQHCGMPIREISVGSEVVDGKPVHRVGVDCDAQQLLDRFADWRHAEADIRARLPSFSIGPVIVQSLADLKRMDSDLRAYEAPELRAAAGRQFVLLREAAAEDPQGAVVEVITDAVANKTQFRFLAPPERTLQELGFNSRLVARV